MSDSATAPVPNRDFQLPELNSLEEDSLASMNLLNLAPRFFRLAVVNSLSNLMVPLAGVISVAFLGHLPELRHLTGVTLSTILFNYIYRTLGFLRMTTTGIVAQAVGRGDREPMLLVGLRNGLLALLMGLAILILQYPLQQLGFALLSGTLEVKSSGVAYYDARIWAAPATLLNFVLFGWFLGREQSNKVLLMSAVGNGANIALDYLLIIRWGWESGGAGAATTISQYLTVVVGMILLGTEIQWQEVRPLIGKLLDPSAMKAALTLNGNIFVRTFAFLSAFSAFTNLSSVLGNDTLAENALLLQVVTVAVYLIDGLAFGTESLVGIFVGQGIRNQLAALLRLSSVTSLVLGLSLALLFVVFPEPLLGLLTNHAEALARIKTSVPWLLPVLGFASLAFIFDGYFLGLAEGATLRNVALVATLVGFAPMAVIAWQAGNNNLLWLALCLFMVVRAVGLLVQIPRTLKIVSQPPAIAPLLEELGARA